MHVPFIDSSGNEEYFQGSALQMRQFLSLKRLDKIFNHR